MAIPILIPLLNPNEPEASLADLRVAEGQSVQMGDVLCVLETTKSTAEVAAEASGYIRGLRFRSGQNVRAGEVLGFLTESPDETIPDEMSFSAGLTETKFEDLAKVDGEIPANLRISQPALALARQFHLDLSTFPQNLFITESYIRARLAWSIPSPDFPPPGQPFDPTSILVYGGGGHGKSVIELIQATHLYQVAGVVDDGIPAGQKVLRLPVFGGQEALTELFAQGVRLAANAVGGIGDIAVRILVFQRLAQAGFACPILVHQTAYIEPSARLAGGLQVFPHAYIGSEARLGFGVIINTGAIVSHDCSIDDYANISPGAMLAGDVKVGAGALIGMGATINLSVKVGAGARIGNSAVIKKDVPDHGIVRAGAAWPE